MTYKKLLNSRKQVLRDRIALLDWFIRQNDYTYLDVKERQELVKLVELLDSSQIVKQESDSKSNKTHLALVR